MSLDVYLLGGISIECICNCGHVHKKVSGIQHYEDNITHNLHRMADDADIGRYLWEPEILGITKAGDLINPLSKGLALLVAEPDRFKKLNSPNGHGRYEDLISFVRNYLKACQENPKACVHVSR